MKLTDEDGIDGPFNRAMDAPEAPKAAAPAFCPVCKTRPGLTPKGFVRKHPGAPGPNPDGLVCAGSGRAPEGSPEEQEANRIADLRGVAAMDLDAEILRALSMDEKKAAEARAKALADLAAGRRFETFLSWDAEHLVMAEEAALMAEEVRHRAGTEERGKPVGLPEAVRRQAEAVRRGLLGGDFDGGSSCPFTNATRAKRAKARAGWLSFQGEYLLHAIRRTEEARAEVAALDAKKGS